MKTGFLLIPVMFCSSLFPVFAEEVVADSRLNLNPQTASCPMTENSQINVSFNSQETDLSKIKSQMESRLKSIEALAKQAGVDQFEMQSMNYNIYANSSGGYNCAAGETAGNNVYQLNGNISFNVQPSGKATDLMVLLDKNGYVSGLNVNMYRACP